MLLPSTCSSIPSLLLLLLLLLLQIDAPKEALVPIRVGTSGDLKVRQQATKLIDGPGGGGGGGGGCRGGGGEGGLGKIG